MNKILDCNIVRGTHLGMAEDKIKELEKQPRLLVIQIGNNPSSERYIRNKIKTCQDVGIYCHHQKINNESISEELLIKSIQLEQEDYDAVIVQCPLPEHINVQNVMNAIDPKKDCDALGKENIMLLHTGEPAIVPATAQGILDLLDFYQYDVEGENILLIGRSQLVNKPLQELLCQRNATVTLAHSKTANLGDMLENGGFDIIISAVGKPKCLEYAESKLLIDVGINFDEDGRMCGDFDIDSCTCKYYTSVPKGVGLLTQEAIVCNVIKCYEMQHDK